MVLPLFLGTMHRSDFPSSIGWEGSASRMDELVDLCSQSIPRTRLAELLETAFAIRMGEAPTIEALDAAFRDCNTVIDQYVTSEVFSVPQIVRMFLRLRLRLVYLIKSRRMQTETLSE